jgi:hypothetical protein
MSSKTSPYGFAYILHMPLEGFNTFVKGGKTPTKLHFLEEREDIQVITSAGFSRPLTEHATIVFELWTGVVHKSRNVNQDRYSLEIILESDEPLKKVDRYWAFGALHYEVMRQIEWKREACESAYHRAYSHGYQLPEVPNSQRFRRDIETPNLAALLLSELTMYLTHAEAVLDQLLRKNECETVRDLGRLLQSMERSTPRSKERP